MTQLPDLYFPSPQLQDKDKEQNQVELSNSKMQGNIRPIIPLSAKYTPKSQTKPKRFRVKVQHWLKQQQKCKREHFPWSQYNNT